MNNTGVTILIADDDLDFCQVLQKRLDEKFERSRIIICGDGQECLEAYKSNNPHVVIMDVMMPIMNGWEACRQIRQHETDQGNARRALIIMVTAIGPQLNEMTSPLYDADEYIDKPMNMKDLANLVFKLFKKNRTA